MANHKSAVKAHQKSLERQMRNSRLKSRMRRAIRATRTAIDAGGDATAARDAYRSTTALLDTLAGKGIIHRNTAARHKSRLTGHLQQTTAAK